MCWSCVFPYLLDANMRAPALMQARRRLLGAARGRVLELGSGTGTNFPLYRAPVESVDAVEPSARLARLARRRLAEASVPINVHDGVGESLAFADETFDVVVLTLTLCSVQDPDRVLAETRRVLKGDGRLLLLEHGLSPDARIARWQRRLNPLNRWLGEGCELLRAPLALTAASGFDPEEHAEYYLPGVPRVGGYVAEARLAKAA